MRSRPSDQWRSRPSDQWRSRPLIRLDKVHKFAKYEAPFGAACGHHRWSREGKKLAVLSSISESWRLQLEVPRPFITRMPRCEITKFKFCLALGHSQWAYGINARPCEFNPTVQVNLNMIGGLLLHFTVNYSVMIQLVELNYGSWMVGVSVAEVLLFQGFEG